MVCDNLRIRSGSASQGGTLRLPSAEYLHDRRSIVGAERRIERGSGLFPDQRARVLERERGTVQAIHAGVLPLDRDGTVVTDGAERAEAVLPRDVAVARRHEVPAPTRVTPGQVRAKDPAAAGGVRSEEHTSELPSLMRTSYAV